MTKIYSAKELADLVEDPTVIETKLEQITGLAHQAALEGKRSLCIDTSEADPYFKPLTDRLGALGFSITYYDGGQYLKGYIEIIW